MNPETLRRIRRIEIKTRRQVTNAFAGAYHSAFKGRGMAFDVVRPYEYGDDPRDIDWNVTARMNLPYIKKYAEEREMTALIMLDSSASCFFGTRGALKHDLAVELGALLALSATTNNDNVGLLIFGDSIETFAAPRKGRNHVLRIIRDLLTVTPERRGTDLGGALRAVNRFLKQRAILFVLSDFLAPPESYALELAVTARRHDVVAVVFEDPREQAWDDAGLVALRDAETGERLTIDTGSAAWRASFADYASRFREARDSALSRADVDRITLTAGDDPVLALTRFFQRRVQRA